MIGKLVFITGATGFIGCHMASKLLKAGCRVIALAREKNGMSPRQRLTEAISQVDPAVDITERNLIAIDGCMEDDGRLWLDAIRARIDEPIDEVWHHAAIFKIFKSCREEVKSINVDGVKRMLDFVVALNGSGEMPRYFHVSTAYSNGKAESESTLITEEIKDRDTEFRSIYDWSKHQGECLVQKYQQDYQMDTSILRPSIVVSNMDSKVVIHAAYYHVLATLYTLRKRAEATLGDDFDGNMDIRFFSSPHTPLNMVPIDYVVEAMYGISRKAHLQTKELKIFNIVNEKPPSMELIYRMVCECLDLSGIRFATQEDFDAEPMTPLERVFDKRIVFQAPYTREITHFSDSKFRAVMGYDELPVPQIDEAFLRNINKNFLEVHEAGLSKSRVEKTAEKAAGSTAEKVPAKRDGIGAPRRLAVVD